ncbi:MAG: type IX secretion system sortase PorU [Candidatus Eisenbacteria bacterium]|nr:type IX secretion system sortase PorU [Candidatus Eisenbacteria bacterium]
MGRKIAPVLWAALVVALLSPTTHAAAPTLISSDDSSVVVRLEPGPISFDPLSVGDREYVRVWAEGTGTIGLPGAPDLPVARVALAVPDCDGIELEVRTIGSSSQRGPSVIPAMTTIPAPQGEIARYEYQEGEQYARDGLWPPAAASIGEPGWLSRQRIVHLEIYPCQFDAEQGVVVAHEAVEVSLRFTGIREQELPRGSSPRWEQLYRAVLLNYDQGRSWRARPTERAERPGEYFDSSDNWLKLTLGRRGVYRMTYDDLAAEVEPGTIDPASIRVFTGPGVSLPAGVDDPRPDWMEECDIKVVGEEDGQFDPNDAVIFYGVGTDGWNDDLMVEDERERYHENRYTGTAVYWMTWESDGTPFADPPRRMGADDQQDDPDPLHVTDYRARAHYEQNKYSFPGRSDNFYMYEMKKTTPESWYSHNKLYRVITDSTGVLRARADGNSVDYYANPDHYALFYLNDVEAYVGGWDAYGSLIFAAPGLPIRDYLPDEPGPDYNTFQVFVPRADAQHTGDNILVDWYEIDYWRELWADADLEDGVSDDMLEFGSSGRTGVLEYSLDGFVDENVSVYKIIDRYSVRSVPGVAVSSSASGFSAVFQDDVADTAGYIAVSDAGYLTPGIARDVVHDVRFDEGLDYVMIVYDGFYEEATRLAGYRQSSPGGGYDVRLVRVSDVYDEFSWGLVDPTAIRDYLKFLNDNADVPPTHVLLIGDASLDYRHYQTTGIDCFIPSWYTGGQKYWPTDVWFVGFDANSEYEPGMALGRLSVRSAAELSTITDKIERYEQDTQTGIWKNTAILVGDDEWTTNPYDTDPDPNPRFEYDHTIQAEQIADDTLPWPLDTTKIYLMEYDFDGAGHKPAARADLLAAWNKGSLIMNYTGHGNELLMAHELVFLIDDIPRLRNIDRLPLFFAASCRLNRFDMENSDSVGELLVKSPVGGAIGSIGSTRDSGAGYNSELNRAFLAKTFGDQREAPTAALDLGQALQAGFIQTSTHLHIWLNNTEFMLVGDPALTLVSPAGSGEFADAGIDLAMARRETVTIVGANGGGATGRSGIALLRVSDSADTSGYTHTWPQMGDHVDYSLPGKTVFEGSAVVSEGEFLATFIVSALSEEGPYARIRAYFYDDETDGSFSLENVAIAGSVETSDAVGPDISMLFEGGATAVLPGDKLGIRFHDDSGINLVNREEDDGIVLRIDPGVEPTDVTGDFAFDTGSFREGGINYELPSLGLGKHTISVDASDNMGNRSAGSLQFEVVSSTDFSIRNVANYPNPFSGSGGEGTNILFQLPVSAEVTIDVFTVGGRRMRHIGGVPGQVGANEVYWDGLDQEGDELANGVYLYRIHAVSDEYRGDKADAIGRAVIMR